MMLGARIGTMAENGEVMSEQFKKFIIGGNAFVGEFDGSAITTNFTARQHLFNGLSAMTSCIMPTMMTNNYMFNNCAAMTYCEVRGVTNNATVFSGCSSLAKLKVAAQIASVVVGYANMLNSLPHTCVVECSDADIKYINGVWTVVSRDSQLGGGITANA